MAVSLMVGLGTDKKTVDRSLGAALAAVGIG
jgi:hypothetical protein